MQKLRRHFTTIAKALMLSVVVVGGAFVVSAQSFTWAPPTANAPQGNVAPPINVSTTPQTKGGILTFLGNSINSPTITAGLNNGSTARALFTAGIFDVGNVDIFGKLTTGMIGNSQTAVTFNRANPATFFVPTVFKSADLETTPISIDLTSNSAANDPEGRNAINITGGAGNESVGVIQNKNKFFFYNYGTGNDEGPVTVQAGKVQLQDGTEGEGKVLVSSADGVSRWVQPVVNIFQELPPPPKARDLLDIKYRTGFFGNAGGGTAYYVKCPTGYVSIAASCDGEDGVDFCLIASKTQNGGVDRLPEYGFSSSAVTGINQYTVNVTDSLGNGGNGNKFEFSPIWDLPDPQPNYVVGNGKGSSNDLHVQATCLRFNGEGNNGYFVWKSLDGFLGRDRYCGANSSDYVGAVNPGPAGNCSAPGKYTSVYSNRVRIGSAGQSAATFYQSIGAIPGPGGSRAPVPDAVISGNTFGKATTAFNINGPQAIYPGGWNGGVTQAQLNQGLGTVNTNVHYGGFPRGNTGGTDNIDMGGCLYTSIPAGQVAPGRNPRWDNTDYGVDGYVFGGPCESNPQGTTYNGTTYPATLYPLLNGYIYFLQNF